MTDRWSSLRALWSRRPPPSSAGDLGLLALFALLGMVVLVSLASPARYQLDAFEVGMSLRLFDRGRTTVFIPPVGAIQAETHMTPLEFQVTLNQVDLDGLAVLLGGDDPAARVERAAISIIGRFVARVLVLAALGGIAGAAFAGRRLLSDLIRSAAVAVIVMGLLLGVSAVTYERQAFASARYTGVIGGAPWMVGVFEDSLVRIRELGERLEFLAANLYEMFQRLDELETLGRVRGDVRVLLVADIHNNPASIEFMAQVVRSFGIHFVVDAGDITDFGSPVEALLVEGIADLGVPYLLAPGNHEAPPVIAALAAQGITILDGRPVTVAGLTVLGFTCPGAASSDPAIPPDKIEELAGVIERTLDRLPAPPFMLVSHVPATVNRFAGRVPVIVSGHLHVMAVMEQGGSVLLNPGTTGAAGVRGITARGDIPMSVIVLYVEFTPEGPVAVAADTIRIYKVRTGFTLQRVLFEGGE